MLASKLQKWERVGCSISILLHLGEEKEESHVITRIDAMLNWEQKQTEYLKSEATLCWGRGYPEGSTWEGGDSILGIRILKLEKNPEIIIFLASQSVVGGSLQNLWDTKPPQIS